MNILLWILQAILNSITSILWKKSVDVSNVSKGLFLFYPKLVGLTFVLVFMVLGLVNYDIFFDIKTLFIVTIVILIWLWTWFIKQAILKENKVSSIIPFENLAPLFTILLWYFLFHKASIYSFVISIIAVVLVILFSIDYKTFRFPKKVSLLFLHQWLLSIEMLLIAYALNSYNWASIAAVDVFVWSIILLLFLIKLSELKQIHKQKKEFYIFRFWAGYAWWFAYIITLFLISNLWIVLSTLLGFLTLGITLILWYFFLNDKPNKKDVVLAVLITILVWLWMYFK